MTDCPTRAISAARASKSNRSATRMAIRSPRPSGYTDIPSTPITSLEELQSAIQKTTCIIGIDWYDSMLSPTKCSELQMTGAIAGGHEVQVISWNRDLSRSRMKSRRPTKPSLAAQLAAERKKNRELRAELKLRRERDVRDAEEERWLHRE